MFAKYQGIRAIFTFVDRLFVLQSQLRNCDHESISVCIRIIKRKRLHVKNKCICFTLVKLDLRRGKRSSFH